MSGLPFPGLTVRDVAALWHYHPQYVRSCIDDGKLRARKSGRTVIIDPASVRALWGDPPRKANAISLVTSTTR